MRHAAIRRKLAKVDRALEKAIEKGIAYLLTGGAAA